MKKNIYLFLLISCINALFGATTIFATTQENLSNNFSFFQAADCPTESIMLNTQEALDQFVDYYQCLDCTTLDGDLIIGGTVTDLSDLSFLTSITGKVAIEGAITLNSLQGLENITTIGGSLRLVKLDALESLAGLNGAAITNISQNLTIRGNTNLIDISALSGLSTINGNLRIVNNATTLCGLFNTGTIGGAITMAGNKSACNNPTQVFKNCSLDTDDCPDRANFTYLPITDHYVHFTADSSLEANARYLWKVQDSIYILSKTINLKVLGTCTAARTKTIDIPHNNAPENTIALCTDGYDNDGDGLIDAQDSDCSCLLGNDIQAGFTYTITGTSISLTDVSSGAIAAATWECPFPIIFLMEKLV